MKKFLCLLIVAALLFSFTACGKKRGNKETNSNDGNVIGDIEGSNNGNNITNSNNSNDNSNDDSSNHSTPNGGNNNDDSNKNDSNGDESNENGSNDNGTTGDGTNGDGTNGDGTNGDDSNGDDSNGDGTNGDGTNGDGTNDDGTNGDGINEKVDLSGCLETLLQNYKWDPESIIPEKLHPEYSGNLIDVSSVPSDYSSFVSVSKIPQNGVGEQWHMVIENIQQAKLFFNALTVVDSVSTLAVAEFNNHIDKNPADTARYEFKEGIYNVTINCTEKTVQFVLDYSAELPVLGEQSVQIALSMDIATKATTARVQIGDMNAMKYTIDGNNYTFAVKYLGVRRAYFELSKNEDDSLTGHIYEYIDISITEIPSVADFYISGDYLTVVGNKADGMMVFDGTICELYSISEGKMIGYEVKESLEVLGSGVTYNTLWFDLEDIDGINSIKYLDKDSSASGKNEFYINGSSNIWSTVDYGFANSLLKGASRRFDIEFRTQYFYYYDVENNKYETVKIEVPMLFVQQEMYNSLEEDVSSVNSVDISVDVSEADLNKLTYEYLTKTDLINENKDKYTVEVIITFIGDKTIFEDQI